MERKESLGIYQVTYGGGAEDVREGMTSTGNQQPLDPTARRKRGIVRRTRAQGREERNGTGEGGGRAKKSKKTLTSPRREVENEGDYDY